jgi:hypothetical protein
VRPEDLPEELNRDLIVLIIGFLRHHGDGRTAHLLDKSHFLPCCCRSVT